MSAKIPNDQFLLFAFDGAPAAEPMLAQVRRRAAVCHDLRLRILDDHPARFPRWVFADVPAFAEHGAADWRGCLDRVAGLAEHQLHPTVAAWRLHVFTPVEGVPGASGAATVAVLQISHALADGTRSAALAGWLFGRAQVVAPVIVPRRGSLLARSVTAARTHNQQLSDIESGLLAAAPAPRPALLTNAAPAGRRQVRTLLRPRAALDGPTVTVAALAAVGTALADYLGERGADVSQLAAEVPMAHSGIRLAHNHFRNVGVGLYPGVADRMELIAADLAAARTRGEHPAAVAARRSFAAVPAPLLRWGVHQFDATARSPVVTGNTVVTSVNRGPADLYFGAAPVLFTTGYPALSPMMSLVHGVHGLGDTVAVSVHAAESAGDIDDYVDRLERALG
ncbi:DUF1298 domain-containing protein [Mycobacterium sp. MS1601]|uniref:DUF1298 domain-containing protein n=1 Tax=Mycobacterium sp. MS1601 TaxID=1936029 RepID=UPI00097976D6|nr:DUF1298 domain-containing protein [Mycobacterium sp. MS1601]AQA06498.1 DUF1298 domain-containing protein [Mycobacterium sp. MS1601]